jgi:hypothetical protein
MVLQDGARHEMEPFDQCRRYSLAGHSSKD